MYPWHPLSGQEIIVCGRTSHGGVPSYLVTLPDGTLCGLPVWMTDARAARDAVLRDDGLASQSALEALRSLVDEIRDAWARSAASTSTPPASGDLP